MLQSPQAPLLDPNHIPDDFLGAVERTLIKFGRDFLGNLLVAGPLMVADGKFEPKLLLPTLGMVIWRTIRDIIPAASKNAI